MLLLIFKAEIERMTAKNSNTSHVTINQKVEEKSSNAGNIQIHLMLLLIHPAKRNLNCERNSNTSHVTINLAKKHSTIGQVIFKYISCYY